MKPPAFSYVAVSSVEAALAELARYGEDAKLLAGGQSLVPMLNMRLISPGRLVDLNRVRELAYIRERDGGVAIGAMTRQRAVEKDRLVAARIPLLAEAMPWVGHFQIRNRGTIGGSLAHADPAAELPAVAVCLDAQLTVRGPEGERVVPAREFFKTYLTTVMRSTELLTEVWFQASPPRSGAAWVEFARRHGDYALAAIGAVVVMADDVIREVRLALTGVEDVPVRASEAEALLAGQPLSPERLEEVVAAVKARIKPSADIHATAEYRRHLAGVLTARALRLAVERAGGEAGR